MDLVPKFLGFTFREGINADEIVDGGFNLTDAKEDGPQVGEDLSRGRPVQSRRDDAYDHAREALFAGAAHIVPGDVSASGRALLELADVRQPPLRVLFGVRGLEEVREEYARQPEGWQRWDTLSRTAHGSAPAGAEAGA